MDRFTRWILEADREETLPSRGEFYWSAGTYYLFQRCPRAWYYTHYLAQGGHDLYSRDSSRHAYLLKYLRTMRSFLEESTEKALFAALQSTLSSGDAAERSELLTDCFQTELTQSYFRAVSDVEHDRYLRDPKYIAFAELHYKTGSGGGDRDRFFRELLEKLRSFVRNFEKQKLPEHLCMIDPLYLHSQYSFQTFEFYGQLIAMRPWIYAFTGKAVHAWKISFVPAEDGKKSLPEEDLSLQVLASFCQIRYGRNIPCFVTVIRQSEKEFSCRKVQVRALDKEFLENSSSRIRKVLDLPGGIRKENFPCTEESGNCTLCRFRALCKV